VIELTAAGGRVDLSWQEDDGRQCSNCTRVFPWISIQHLAWSFEVLESVRMVGAQRTKGSRKKWTECVCPCNIYYGIVMELINMLLGNSLVKHLPTHATQQWRNLCFLCDDVMQHWRKLFCMWWHHQQ
jgi:hypothetical protein